MKKIIAGVLAFAIVAFNGYMFLEGAVVSAATTTVTSSGSASLNWDVYLDVGNEIALTCDNANIYLGSINGMTGGNLQADRDCNVKANSGWTLAIAATNSPAMITTTTPTNSFSDRSTTKSAWSNNTASSSYGFAVSSSYSSSYSFTDISIYSGFNGTNNITIAGNTTSTVAAGVTTTIRFRAEVGATRNQPTGRYTSHVVVTATASP
ncbi:MAG: hypothetical protein WC457_01295 [Patescibacteria group bacterium]